MMGISEGQSTFFHDMSIEWFVPRDHPVRAIRHLIDVKAVRYECRNLYSPIGRPLIPPQKLWPAAPPA